MYPYYEHPLKQILGLLTFNGINPLKNTLFAKILVFLEVASTASILFLTFLQFIYSDMSMKLFVDSVESLFTTSQILTKSMTLVLKKNEIKEVFVQVSKFWSLSQFDSYFQNECLKQLRNIRSAAKLFIILCTLVIVFFMFCPLYANRLTIVCYIPKLVPEKIFAVYNSWVFGFNGMLVVAFDSFICTITFMLSLQYKLLNKKIQMLKLEEVASEDDERMCLHEVQEVVDYHIFLWDFAKLLNSILGYTSFIQLILYTVSTCFEMYLVSRGYGFFENAKSLFYITTLSFEMMLCFCIPSAYLTSEASKTFRILYETKWYECPSVSLQKCIFLMMVNAQRVVGLWAGGLFVINLETATEAFKKTLSFYTCLKTIGEDQNS